ncbi:MAG: sulfatase-like hydrolase/transferase, partial [Bacteroidota bacterium]
KVDHSLPKFDIELEKFDLIQRGLTKDNELGFGRDPNKYYDFAKSFFSMAKEKNKPFFLMANSHDPHRPFSGSDDEKSYFGDAAVNGIIPDPSKIFSPEEIIIPGFLPDLPPIRKEIAQYYSSVRRCDDTVGKLLQALKESGLDRNTLIIFISDNGMAFPFAKTNCYLNSTKTPFIAKWSGEIKQSVDTTNFISGIDFLPTILEAVGIPIPGEIDGTSFLPLLRGEKQDGRDMVYTQFHVTSAKMQYPMRAVQSKHFGYIFNPWSVDSIAFKNASMNGLTFKAMQEEAKKDKEISERVNLFKYRVVEEFYNFSNDPDALNNLIDDKSYSETIDKMRKELKNWMEKNNDPSLVDFNKYVKTSIDN